MRSPSLILLLAVAPGTLGAQTVVPIEEEPRHRLVHETAALRVLDIEIAPGDTTLFHRHDAPVVYVVVSPTPTNAQVLGRSWGAATRDSSPVGEIGRVMVNEAYATAPVDHRVTNLGEVPFRLIAVLNRGPGQDANGNETPGPTGPPETESRWFRTTHHTLGREATWDWEGVDRPVVVVLVSSGAIAVGSVGGAKTDLQAPGDFAVLPAGARAELRNAGGSPVTLALVEVR